MKIIIISLPRTGSSQLLFDTSNQYNLKPIFEPFSYSNINTKLYNVNDTNIVVKTIIGQTPKKIKFDINDNRFIDEYLKWICDFVKDFDKIILLSRKDLTACVESLSFLIHTNYKNNQFRANQSYYYKRPPDELFYKCETQIILSDKIMNILTNDLNIPITYYEDIYDLNSPNRLRKGDTANSLHLI
jgi:hypothetical protein